MSGDVEDKLNVLATRESQLGKDVLMIGNPDGSLNVSILTPGWYVDYVELVENIHHICEKGIEPIIWKSLETITAIDLKQEFIHKTISSNEPDDKNRPIKVRLKLSYPWRIHQPKEHRPFY